MYVHVEKREGVDPIHHLLVKVGKKVVTVWVENDYCRYFTHSELPAHFKQALVMINATEKSNYTKTDKFDYSFLEPRYRGEFFKMLYLTSKDTAPEGFLDIGWSAANNYYYVVTPAHLVTELKVGAEKQTEVGK